MYSSVLKWIVFEKRKGKSFKISTFLPLGYGSRSVRVQNAIDSVNHFFALRFCAIFYIHDAR